MNDAWISVIGTLLGTLVGSLVTHWFANAQSKQYFRRVVLRDIALEYRRLAETGADGDLSGLIRAGIRQCKNNKEYLQVLNLTDDLQPKIETGTKWRPNNGKYVTFFKLLRERKINPTEGEQVQSMKQDVESA